MVTFRALPGFSFSVDSRGCLVITSGSMSFGSLVTNDIVELVSEREFVWKGRFDNVINSGGIKIFPEEIERVIAPLLPATGLFYVTSRRSERWGEEAVIVTDCEKYADDSSEGDALLSALRELLPPHHLPKAVIYEPFIALTSSKKIVRRRLG